MRTPGMLALVAVLGCESAPTPNAADVVDGFYDAAIGGHVSGAPTAEQLATLAPYLSDTLRALLVAARKRNEADVARAPGEKPSFAEGDLFSSLFEGPDAARVIADSARGADRVAFVRMTHSRSNPPTTWVDRVVLKRQGTRYVIDDIEYGGQWDFASKGTLRSSLVSTLTSPP